MISICVKLEDFRLGKVPRATKLRRPGLGPIDIQHSQAVAHSPKYAAYYVQTQQRVRMPLFVTRIFHVAIAALPRL
jgi:hypothetical protein